MRRGLTIAEMLLLILLLLFCGGVFYAMPSMPTRSVGLPGTAVGFWTGLAEGALVLVNLAYHVVNTEHAIYTLHAGRGYDLGFLLGGALLAPVVCNPLLLRIKLSGSTAGSSQWIGPIVGLAIAGGFLGGFFAAGIGHPAPYDVPSPGLGLIGGSIHGLMSPFSLLWSLGSPTTAIYQGGNGLGYDIGFCLPELAVWAAGVASLFKTR